MVTTVPTRGASGGSPSVSICAASGTVRIDSVRMRANLALFTPNNYFKPEATSSGAPAAPLYSSAVPR